ncbi:MAG TPA: 5-formyltetrahydrofolate cyclo-ligase [Afifellaceae bacterium]|nr:5-formyltetrahydrofolate cyclo-ligase [Afifellaceae bacterium]
MTAPADWKAWRRGERERLIALRLAMPPDERRRLTAAIADHLDATLDITPGTVLAFYWPIRGEPNLIPWVERLHERGVRPALPVVVAKGQPMQFRPWAPGAAMVRGIWNIPMPADETVVTPEIVLAPLVGFDRQLYRLGYGGGFFDRTLAALDSKPMAIGVGYAAMELPTVHPQPHDIAMDVVVTEQGVLRG